VRHWNLLEIDAPDGTRDPVVLYSEEEARAVLIRLEAGQRLGDHQVKERSWITVVDGVVRMGSGGTEIEAGPGTLFRFEPNERHSVASDGGARILLLLAPWPGDGHYRGEELGAGRSA
jgi:quercetin dioxygenase-like cupin family protein